ncbi:ABC transporter substrate-binding protein [Salipiger marinus]|uniref:Amino acid/amide ABC transporter substrate-binding protein, HAAT family (TC 3.A.1.4.-) n=1 Tax=Salipiger marinus TaxID=555512 RepID=A0A1G8PPM0_9RHOB|nr:MULTISPECIES: ABC transporter substrate-binding protein [Salipiger]MCD1619442.1 ABC transporter substrate-binding protein [Salipiger manganoxidans]MEB3420276.1 ABC transporter substrate-binding protein [Salipiger manganoxidans]SDI94444.1 amino acid/amide ABC transporter substrate-binding protein, HAAT family (TC 3.A.1.4.-) [Salipiger marinus]
MKKWLMASALPLFAAGTAMADDAKIGVIMGYTGPIESLTPAMSDAAELAMIEVNDSGKFLEGVTLVSVRADSTCVDSAAATAAAERLVTTDGIVAIMGADCSGVTGAVLSNVAVPNGVPMVSPSATSPALSEVEDNGLFFRTAPSDARQGEVLAGILQERGISSVAVTYTNNDYGKGFADAFEAAFTGTGGQITLTSPHEDNKADYSAEVGALASAGGDALVVLGYADSGGKGMIQAALDSGAFDTFALGDGMYSETLLADLGGDLEGSFGSVPWAEGEGADAFAKAAEAAGIVAESTYTRESYDAAALIALAMMKGGEPSSAAVAANLLDVANAPGEPILPGELGKALEILASGGDVDYVGATNVELIGAGEAAGSYRYYEIKDATFETVSFK